MFLIYTWIYDLSSETSTFFEKFHKIPQLFRLSSNFCRLAAAISHNHGLPDGADSSFFLCQELIPGYLDGITGEYATPQGYFVAEEDAEEFDKAFPYKEKLKLPGQLFN